MVVGLTGGVGAGKSRILELLKEDYGARIIQADQVAKELEEPGEPGLAALVEAFGEEILDQDGRLAKEAFASRIYHSKEDLERVNRILHPMTWQAIQDRLLQAPEAFTVVEAALFDERGIGLCDKLVFVDTTEENRIQRLMEGRGYSREKCLEIMKNQPERQEFLRISDEVLDNNGTLEEMKRQLAGLMEEWKL